MCVNADGFSLPPFIIFPGENVNVQGAIIGAHEGALFVASESSFLVTNLLVQYFKWFVRKIPCQRPILAIMDGYKAHFSIRTSTHAREHGVFLYALPVHTSHFLQPLGMYVFQRFKRELDNDINHYQKTTLMMVGKSNVFGVGASAICDQGACCLWIKKTASTLSALTTC